MADLDPRRNRAWRLQALLIAVLTGAGLPVHPGAVETLTTADGVEVTFHRYPAQGDRLLVWWPSEHGLETGHSEVASQLSRSGIEVWIADPFATWFLPTLRASLAEIPRETCGAFLQLAHTRSGKRLYAMGNDRGAAVLLECLSQAFQQGLQTLGGIILISPDLFTPVRQPGQRRELVPLARAANFPVFVVLAEKSIERLYRDEIVNALSNGGSRVYHTVVQAARNRFFFRPDAVATELEATRGLPQIVLRSIELLDHDDGPRGFRPVRDRQKQQIAQASRRLVRYGGPPLERLRLPGLDGHIHDSADYAGEVLLVSFWASWCPPCVHELPSMVRLQQAYSARPFRVLAVNLGEDIPTINDFLKLRPVNFPVLLDAGLHFAKRWQVTAFPSSFLLDAGGQIRYTVAGAIEWDDPAVIAIVEEMLQE